MNKRKNIIVISIICVVVIAIIVGLYAFINSIIPRTYSSARQECKKVLNKYQIEMEQIAVDSLKTNNSGDFRDYFYSCYQEGVSLNLILMRKVFLVDSIGNWFIRRTENFMVKRNRICTKKPTETILLEQKRLMNIGGIFGQIMTVPIEVINN